MYAGPDLPLLQQLGRLPLNIPTEEAASSSLLPGWRVWHKPLQLFACINPPYISATSKMNPAGSLHSGHFNMLLYEGLSGFMGRVHALSFLAKAETGSHLNTPTLVQDKVRKSLCVFVLLGGFVCVGIAQEGKDRTPQAGAPCLSDFMGPTSSSVCVCVCK